MTAYTAQNIISLIDDDLNGDCFIAGAEGEPEVIVENNIVSFPAGFPSASDANSGQPIAITGEQANVFLYINAVRSVAAGRSIADATRIAYIRFLAARHGLVSPDFTTVAHNVKYNHAVRVSATEDAAFREDIKADKDTHDAFANSLTGDHRKIIRSMFTDMVCCVAYVFRVRGHHYRDDFKDKYAALWSRCLHKESDLLISWEHIATDSLHAIMPDILDSYWQDSAGRARCAGTLIKRLDSAPAGVAGLFALNRGLKDIMMLFPGVATKVPDAYDRFDSMIKNVETSRWGGSINCRFYGVARIRIDEGAIGALASVVMGVYDQLAPDSKLRDSPSLRRLAEIAPATGGAIGQAARRAAADERMSLITDVMVTPD